MRTEKLPRSLHFRERGANGVNRPKNRYPVCCFALRENPQRGCTPFARAYANGVQPRIRRVCPPLSAMARAVREAMRGPAQVLKTGIFPFTRTHTRASRMPTGECGTDP